jgi:hypothetical protein
MIEGFQQYPLYKMVFVAELLVAEHLFLLHLRKRNHFIWRLIASALLLFACAFIPISPTNPLNLITMFSTILAISILLQWFTYEDSIFNIVFFCIVGYCMQFTAYCLDNVFVAFSGIKSDIFGVYRDEVFAQNGLAVNYVFAYIFEFFIYAVTYYIYYLLYGLNIEKYGETKIDNAFMVIVGIVTFALSVVINAFLVFYVTDKTVLIAAEFYSVLFCFLIVYLMFTALKKKETEENLKVVTKLLRDSKNNYELSKKNIEMINIKCHDLKHQIRTIGETNAISREAINEIEDVVSIYDSQINTGNNVLDTILTEKSLYCYRNKIKLTCIADGKALSFLGEVELYALFGNLIDNASHAVKGVEDEDRRYIGISIQQIKGFVTINIHNFYVGNVKFDGEGLPITTRSDKENHGFGYKSISYIVEKYKGTMTIDDQNNLFSVDIIFPTPKEA